MLAIAIISFPGTNNEVESVRAVKRAGMRPVCVKWNDDPKVLRGCDAYFLVGGFSYEDRGRSGMVAARDPLVDILREEAARGKTVIGHCNGAQILVESGLIPNGQGLAMSLAHNAVQTKDGAVSPGFLNEWITIKRVCAQDRCATSDWAGTLHMPIAHGEGRFTTNDPDLINTLKENDQIAFQYCDANGNVSDDPAVTPNGSMLAIAGICNPEGNVVALMPHPERARGADAYFVSLQKWIESHKPRSLRKIDHPADESVKVGSARNRPVEIFIKTIITNTEERTVEQAARRLQPELTLKQYRYLAPVAPAAETLSSIGTFNPNKEIAYIRENGNIGAWDAKKKTTVPLKHRIFAGTALLRRDLPEKKDVVGVCYDVAGIADRDLFMRDMLAIFHNPHASVLERLQ